LLPQEVLFRKKEAFSDGVSSTQDSWYQTLSSHYSKIADNKVMNVSNQTDEAFFYLETFRKRFKGYEHIIPHYWMPAFVDRETIKDPSARTLRVYSEDDAY
jgi:asparagine synthase (glutamine-hydrolysing)